MPAITGGYKWPDLSALQGMVSAGIKVEKHSPATGSLISILSCNRLGGTQLGSLCTYGCTQMLLL